MFEDLAKIFTVDTIISIIAISLILTMCVYMMLRYDTKKYSKFREGVSIGDEITSATSQNVIHGVVTDIDDEWITIETKVRRHRIYPKTKKSK